MKFVNIGCNVTHLVVKGAKCKTCDSIGGKV